MGIKLRVQNTWRASWYLVTHGRRCRHEKIGAWWPCNYGADEVRMCPTCDLIEKRPMRETEAADRLEDLAAVLFVALMRSRPDLSWFSDTYGDGSRPDDLDLFIAGMDLPLPIGRVTHHLRRDPWWLVVQTYLQPLDKAPVRGAQDVQLSIERLRLWIGASDDDIAYLIGG